MENLACQRQHQQHHQNLPNQSKSGRGCPSLVSDGEVSRNSPFYLLILVDGLEVSRAGFEPATNGDITRKSHLFSSCMHCSA